MSENRATRILIADRQPVLRDGLERLLRDARGFEVVGQAADGEQAVELTLREEPDILLLDLELPRISGLGVLNALNGRGVSTRPILLTAEIHEQELLEALRLGARGVVLKDAPTDLLVKAVRSVVGGQYWFNRATLSNLMGYLRVRFPEAAGDLTPPPEARLTSREREVVQLIAAGCRNRDIATRLHISLDTVKHHLTNIYDKIGVSNRVELAIFAMNNRLAERPASPQ